MVVVVVVAVADVHSVPMLMLETQLRESMRDDGSVGNAVIDIE